MRTAMLPLFARLPAVALLVAVVGEVRADVTFLHRAQLYPTDIEPFATGRVFDYETVGYPFNAGLAVHVRNISTTDSVDVLINNEYLATIPLMDGSGDMELMGQLYTDVPFINHGDVVDIVNSYDGTLLLEGIFN
jgi:hypothetical protein